MTGSDISKDQDAQPASDDRRASRSAPSSSPGCAETITAACHGCPGASSECRASLPPIE